MERRSPAPGRFAVPAAIFKLLTQKLVGQGVVRLLEIRTDAEDPTVDAWFRFALQERPVVERLEDEPLVDAVDHLASLLTGGVETEVFQDDKAPEGNQVHCPPGQLRAGDWRARSWAPQPSVAMGDRSAATASALSPVRSLMTCQRMDGSESRSHLMCADRGDSSSRHICQCSQLVCAASWRQYLLCVSALQLLHVRLAQPSCCLRQNFLPCSFGLW